MGRGQMGAERFPYALGMIRRSEALKYLYAIERGAKADGPAEALPACREVVAWPHSRARQTASVRVRRLGAPYGAPPGNINALVDLQGGHEAERRNDQDCFLLQQPQPPSLQQHGSCLQQQHTGRVTGFMGTSVLERCNRRATAVG